MPRTTPAAVKAILLREYDTVDMPSLQSFIDAASVTVDQVAANDDKQVMTPASLEVVERWLSAHLYQDGDPGYKSRNTAGASGQFQGPTGSGPFETTRFGQSAMMLDSTGWLQRRNAEVKEGGRRRVQMFVG